jgi:hypothetical protein
VSAHSRADCYAASAVPSRVNGGQRRENPVGGHHISRTRAIPAMIGESGPGGFERAEPSPSRAGPPATLLGRARRVLSSVVPVEPAGPQIVYPAPRRRGCSRQLYEHIASGRAWRAWKGRSRNCSQRAGFICGSLAVAGSRRRYRYPGRDPSSVGIVHFVGSGPPRNGLSSARR